jgi:hypothetical protein
MSVRADHSRYLDSLADQVRAADDATPVILSSIAAVCERTVAPAHKAGLARLRRLIENGASTEAALAMIELELPHWKLRRLVYDQGDWHCALSRQRELPEWLDQAVEASHRDLALAILAAFVDALQRTAGETRIGRPSVPQIHTDTYAPFLCENFA